MCLRGWGVLVLLGWLGWGVSGCSSSPGPGTLDIGDVVEISEDLGADGLSVDILPEAVQEQISPRDIPAVDVPPVDTWHPHICGITCPPGFCDEETARCLYCEDQAGCPYPEHWCRDNRCVKTVCVPGSQRCGTLTLAQVCHEDGMGFTETVCEEGQACHVGDCLEIICEAGQARCKHGLVEKCAPTGTGWLTHGCPPGEACFTDRCEPIKHNLLLIFDTSGSMASGPGPSGVPCLCPSCPVMPFPACEDPQCPRSRIGMSKHVFARFFETDAIRSFHLILTRFPLGIKYPPELNCDSMMGGGRGYYGVESVWSPSGDFLPGDNGLHETADGDWFDQNNHQILCVPFPRNWEQDNLAEARLWVNFKEDVAASTEPCTSVGVSLTQCKGGFCAPNDNSEKVCWYHNDPELRAWGNTPLGRSMFYAGELFRKEIRVDGRSCATHADCKNRNYYCSTGGTCKDPMAHCRVNMIVLFTDGEETPATQTSEFFNPQVQAKRFRYGLGCSGDEDCFDGSVCQGAMCQGYPTPNGSGTSPPPNTALPWRLMTYQGNPVQISTHVIDVSGGSTGSATNRAIADHGGGSYFHASEMDPDELLNQLLSIIDVKQNLLGCIPDWEGIALDAL